MSADRHILGGDWQLRVRSHAGPWTSDELFALGSGAPCELSRGELVMMSPPSPRHALYVTRLASALLVFVEEHGLGAVYSGDPGFLLAPDPRPVVRAPDIAFLRHERIPAETEQEGYWPVAPDLAIEVLSPSDARGELEQKVRDFLAAGTALVWIVCPRTRSARVHAAGAAVRELGVDDSLEGGTVLPGFSYALARLFR